jgi:hypothetical protein
MSRLTQYAATLAIAAGLALTAGLPAHAADNTPDNGCSTITMEDGTETILCVDYAQPTNGDTTDPAAPIDAVAYSDATAACAAPVPTDNEEPVEIECKDTGIMTLEGPDCSVDMDACIRSTGMPVIAMNGTSAEVTVASTDKNHNFILDILSGLALIGIGAAGATLYHRRKEDTKFGDLNQ